MATRSLSNSRYWDSNTESDRLRCNLTMYFYLLSRLMRRLPAFRTLLASALICAMLFGTVGIPFPRLGQQDAS